jgi:hypothetical protein
MWSTSAARGSGKDIQAGFRALPQDASMCPEVGTGEPAGTTRCRLCQRVHIGSTSAQIRPPAGSVGGRAGYEASSNQSSPCGGSRAGANVVGVHGSPSAASTARARAESTTTTAITLRRPPHEHAEMRGWIRSAAISTRRHDVAHQELVLEPHGVTSIPAIRIAGNLYCVGSNVITIRSGGLMRTASVRQVT